MDLKQLRSVVTVSELGSVTQAARALHIVQPAVTRHIRQLEDELGTQLFERSRHGMTPTTAGARLVERARRALLEVDRARSETQADPHSLQGVVTVGLLESTVELLAAPLIKAVRARHPLIELRVLAAFSGHLRQWLDDGDVDLSLLYDLTNDHSISTTPLLVERLWVVAPLGSHLDPNRPVPWEDAWAQDLVLPVPGHGLRALIDRAAATTGGTPRIRVETNSMPLQKQLVHTQGLWTILPACGVAHDIAAGRLEGAPLTGPPVERSVVVGRPRRMSIQPQVTAVADELANVARQLVEDGVWPGARAGHRDDAQPEPPRS